MGRRDLLLPRGDPRLLRNPEVGEKNCEKNLDEIGRHMDENRKGVGKAVENVTQGGSKADKEANRRAVKGPKEPSRIPNNLYEFCLPSNNLKSSEKLNLLRAQLHRSVVSSNSTTGAYSGEKLEYGGDITHNLPRNGPNSAQNFGETSAPKRAYTAAEPTIYSKEGRLLDPATIDEQKHDGWPQNLNKPIPYLEAEGGCTRNSTDGEAKGTGGDSENIAENEQGNEENNDKNSRPNNDTQLGSTKRRMLASSARGWLADYEQLKIENNYAGGSQVKGDKQYTQKYVRKNTQNLKNTADSSQKDQAYPPSPLSHEEINAFESLDSLGGISDTVDKLRELILRPLKNRNLYNSLSVTPIRGLLLHGPPGSGKSKLAEGIAKECNCPFFRIVSTELISGVSGDSEEKIRSIFEVAKSQYDPCIIFIDEIDILTPRREGTDKGMERRIVSQIASCLDSLKDSYVFVIGATNRIECIDPMIRRNGRFDKEILMTIPDHRGRSEILKVLVRKLKIAETLNIDQIALNTPGFVGADLLALCKEAAHTAIGRIFSKIERIHQTCCKNDCLQNCMQKWAAGELGHGDVSQIGEGHGKEEGVTEEEKVANSQIRRDAVKEVGMKGGKITEEAMSEDEKTEWRTEDGIMEGGVTEEAKKTNVPRVATCDLVELLAQNGTSLCECAVEILRHEICKFSITHGDFEVGIKRVSPSGRREGFSSVPDCKWKEVGALYEMKDELIRWVCRPMRHPELYKSIGLDMPMGILLYGPPGCGKTLLAKAISNESGANFISVKGPELLNKYVGESERGVRELFQRAASATPCIIFFDELDSLCTKRGGEGGSGGGTERVVNQLLTEMDGVVNRKNIYVIAATNRPDIIDPAMLRPGRLDKLLYVPLPDLKARVDILHKIHKAKNIPIHPQTDLQNIAQLTERYSGADLHALLREACMLALEDSQNPQLAQQIDQTRLTDNPQNTTLTYNQTFQSIVPNSPQTEKKDPPAHIFAEPKINVHTHHLLAALDKIPPSVSEKDKIFYEGLKYTIAKK